jgi:hypothetical protein
MNVHSETISETYFFMVPTLLFDWIIEYHWNPPIFIGYILLISIKSHKTTMFSGRNSQRSSTTSSVPRGGSRLEPAPGRFDGFHLLSKYIGNI